MSQHHLGYLVVTAKGVLQTHHPLVRPTQAVPHRDLQEPLLAVLDAVLHRLKHPGGREQF